MEVGRDRGCGQSHNGDGSSATETRFTLPGKTHRGSGIHAETTEVVETGCGLSNGRCQWIRFWVCDMEPRKNGF